MEVNEIKYEALKELGYVEEPNFAADDDNAVNAINESYDRMYHLALTSYDWSFAKQKASLAKQDNTGRYKYVYTVPDDCLYIRNMYSDENYTNVIDTYERNGGYIYTDSPNLYIVYTKEICEEELPAYFTEYLIYTLARKNCTKITGNRDLLNELINSEHLAFNSAKNTDIKQQEVRILDTSVFTSVRN